MIWKKWLKMEQYRGVILISTLSFALVTLLRLTGKLTTEEFKVYDWMLYNRKAADIDNRIVIVGITEKDIENYKIYPFPDQLYAELLEKIKIHNPRVIGFDIIRDIPVNPGYEKLVKQYKTTPNLIGIGLFFGEKVQPPQVLWEKKQVGDIAVIIDSDGIVRRSFLLTPGEQPVHGFALELVLRYLSKDGIKLKLKEDGKLLQIGKAQFKRFQGTDGAYLGVKDYGFQFLIDYRYSSGKFRHVSFSEVLQGQINENLFRDRIVIIGPTAKTLKDEFLSPYSKWEGSIRQYGVEIHANMVVQLLNAATKGESIIISWSEGWDYLAIVVWTLVTTVILWSFREYSLEYPRKFIFGSIGFILILSGLITIISVIAFTIWSFWIPTVPIFIAIWLGGMLTTIHVMVWKGIKQTQNHSQELAQKLQERTEELKIAQEQLLAQERLAFIGQFESGINHEYGNIISSLSRNLEGCIALRQDLLNIVTNNHQENPLETWQEIREILIDYLNPCYESMQQVLQNFKQIREQFLPIDIHNERRANYKKVNLIKLISTCYKITSQNRLKNVNPQLETDFESEDIECYIVPSELNYVIVNLLNNAWDALEEKQNQKEDKYQPKIRISVQKVEKNIYITIADNGIGIPSDINEKIFQIFYTTKPMSKGTGIGLTLSRDILVGRYKGELILKPDPYWTQFVIILPLQLSPTV